MARAVGCLIEPDRVADVGSQVVGLVERLHVDRGDTVRRGQTLVTCAPTSNAPTWCVADTRSRVDADVLAAQASLDLAEQKVRRAESLVAQNFISSQSVEQARGEAEVARQKVKQVHSQQQIWVKERSSRRGPAGACATCAARLPASSSSVTSTWVSGSRSARCCASLSSIRCASSCWCPPPCTATCPRATRSPSCPNCRAPIAVTATVRQVDTVLDAASNSFRVRLSLPNPGNKLPAGLRCKADVPGADTLAPSPSAAPEAPATVTRPKPAASSSFLFDPNPGSRQA